MATIYDESSLCELMYKMRDAMLSHKLDYALLLSKEIHDRLLFIIANNYAIDCVLECEVRFEDDQND